MTKITLKMTAYSASDYADPNVSAYAIIKQKRFDYDLPLLGVVATPSWYATECQFVGLAVDPTRVWELPADIFRAFDLHEGMILTPKPALLEYASYGYLGDKSDVKPRFVGDFHGEEHGVMQVQGVDLDPSEADLATLRVFPLLNDLPGHPGMERMNATINIEGIETQANRDYAKCRRKHPRAWGSVPLAFGSSIETKFVGLTFAEIIDLARATTTANIRRKDAARGVIGRRTDTSIFAGLGPVDHDTPALAPQPQQTGRRIILGEQVLVEEQKVTHEQITTSTDIASLCGGSYNGYLHIPNFSLRDDLEGFAKRGQRTRNGLVTGNDTKPCDEAFAYVRRVEKGWQFLFELPLTVEFDNTSSLSDRFIRMFAAVAIFVSHKDALATKRTANYAGLGRAGMNALRAVPGMIGAMRLATDTLVGMVRSGQILLGSISRAKATDMPATRMAGKNVRVRLVGGVGTVWGLQVLRDIRDGAFGYSTNPNTEFDLLSESLRHDLGFAQTVTAEEIKTVQPVSTRARAMLL